MRHRRGLIYSSHSPIPSKIASLSSPFSARLAAVMSELTEILQSGNDGAVGASERVFNLVYAELRRIAAAKMAHEAPGQTLQATALVHEVWLRLSQQSHSEWKNREQFYAVAAETMRRILVDRARRRRSRKHGGDLERVHMDAVELPFADNDDLVLQVHDSLEQLATQDPEKAQVVKLRFFVGLENAEIASLLGVSEKTVRRHWTFAKAWLARAMQNNP